MNGAFDHKEYGYDDDDESPPASRAGRGGRGPPGPSLSGKAVLDGYRNEILNGFAPPPPQPNNRSRRGSPEPVDLKDPIQIHLLTETALSDSRGFEILPPEEVDALKKQMLSLTARIEQTRNNLAIQSKYRDAAVSMAKLYVAAPGNNSNNNGGAEDAREEDPEAEAERLASERKCEALARELFSLEKRLMEPQRRLLQHTAGVLQLTHRAPPARRLPGGPGGGPGALLNGMPGSPESLYTYSNGRNSLEPPPRDDDGLLDERALYFPLDTTGGGGGGGGGGNSREPHPLEIPMKSPIRGQQNQLREEADRLRDENVRLRTVELDAAAQLVELGGRLRDVIVRFDPARHADFEIPPPPSAATAAATTPDGGDGHAVPSLADRLAYLERGLAAAEEEQAALAESEAQLQALALRIQDALLPLHPDTPPPPPPPPPPQGGNLAAQVAYLQESLEAIEAGLQRAGELSSSASLVKQSSEQVETMLMGLWEIIQNGFAEIERQKAERRRKRAEKGLVADDDDEGDDDVDGGGGTSEPYSLAAFSAKVQWLFAQATSLKEQKAVLKRQIKQQRELNSKSGAEKDDELRQTTDALRRARDELDTLRADESAAARAAQEQVAVLETQLVDGRAQLDRADEARTAAEAAVEGLRRELHDKDEELERLNVMAIELKTEMTIAKAELDGAYGSRAQRAAEAAALTKSSETSELAGQVDRLKAELASTIKEFEDMTKETIAAEKEKLALEARLDDAVAARASLEAEVRALRDRLDRDVGRLKEELDAEKLKVPASPGVPGQGGGRAGAALLSEQFRATMKEERKKFQEELREEQAKRRKLEDELRAAKKALGPGRSPLSAPLSPR